MVSVPSDLLTVRMFGVSGWLVVLATAGYLAAASPLLERQAFLRL